VPATFALCVHAGRVFSSFQLAPLQPYAAAPAKLVFRTVLSTAKGTKHEAHNSFERELAHVCPKTAAQLFNKMTPRADRLQADFLPSHLRLKEKRGALVLRLWPMYAEPVAGLQKDTRRRMRDNT